VCLIFFQATRHANNRTISMKGESKACFIPLIYALIQRTLTNPSQSFKQPT